MIEAANNVEEFVAGVAFEQFVSNKMLFFAVMKNIEIIGEAAYMLTKEFRAAHPEVEWDEIEGMRHVLVHGYYQIRPSQLWDTIENDIPELQLKIRALYESMA